MPQVLQSRREEMVLTQIKQGPLVQWQDYSGFSRIDGRHPLQDKVPFSYVSYQARVRSGGKVTFFNFALAKEMGLIDSRHTHELNPSLNSALIDTFGLIIVNEYDLMSSKRFKPKELKKHPYMATRYLQLQHSDRRGLTSGDGRSIWNGYWTHKGRTWDISSCGTGATCLSPATSQKKTFFRSGDPHISYGCGYSKLHEGLVDVVFSEILHRNAHKTERVLCVIEFPRGFAVTVRVGENLLRPSHFFLHLKQGRLDRLKALVDYHIQRQLDNGSWVLAPGTNRYRLFLKHMTHNFAEAAARFEAEYIFCWMEWDGDNILADAGIIDYGSVRQFGLFFHEYRFDDDERWSTNLKQQRSKARYIVQTFVQLVDFLQKGVKEPLEDFARAPELDEFDRIYQREKQRCFLRRLGLDADQTAYAQRRLSEMVTALQRIFSILEEAKGSGGTFKVPDGENQQVLFSMRRLLRLLPGRLQDREKQKAVESEAALLQKITAQACQNDPLAQLPRFQKTLREFETLYAELLQKIAKGRGLAFEGLLGSVFRRSALLNREERVTGDAICILAEQLLKQRLRLSSKQFHKLIEEIVHGQVLNPDYLSSESPREAALHPEKGLQNLVRMALRIVHSYREGL